MRTRRAFLREDAPWLHGRLLQGETIRIERLPDELPEDSAREREYVRRTGIKSILVLPIAVGGRFVCALATGAFQTPRAWSDLTVARVQTAGQILAHALYRERVLLNSKKCAILNDRR